jgi:hypothetical protein
LKQKKKYDKLTKQKKKKTDSEKHKIVEEAKAKRDEYLLKQRLKKQKEELPDFQEGDFDELNVKTSSTGGKQKLNPKAELMRKVKDIVDDPDKLVKYKLKHYKGLNDTSDIDALIHKARIEQKKQQRMKAEVESEAFDLELKNHINKARRYLRNERKKGSLKSKSLINA